MRILIGEDATMIDAAVCAKPEAASDHTELCSDMKPGGQRHE
jgi:hypothetical protein